jgi:glycosyltransferase involved in cell wall biosynthesis
LEDRAQEINEKYNIIIEFTSWVRDIGQFNAAMDIVCLTSKNEGTPVSLIEAQAANIPVITTDVGGVQDVVLDGETGYIIQPGDKTNYAKRLKELVEDEKKRENMSQNGWNFVKEKFHYTTLVRNMEGLYKELLSEKRNKDV